MRNTTSRMLNYADVFYSFFSDRDAICHDKAVAHYLMYVVSGEVTAEDDGQEYSVRQGQCVFIRRDHRVVFTKKMLDDQPFKSVTLRFNRHFLRKFYRKMQPDGVPNETRELGSSVVRLRKTPYLDSLFLSMLPFFESGVEPRPELIEQKMEEGVWALLEQDKGFYAALFDFTEPWKIDILDFLNENYMYEFSLEEIASYTGRSLATFKRDFAKISALTPQKWLIRKRLQKAYEMIVDEGRKVSEVCFDVGFKNRSHFTTAFKRQYGFPPNRGGTPLQ